MGTIEAFPRRTNRPENIGIKLHRSLSSPAQARRSKYADRQCMKDRGYQQNNDNEKPRVSGAREYLLYSSKRKTRLTSVLGVVSAMWPVLGGWHRPLVFALVGYHGKPSEAALHESAAGAATLAVMLSRT